MTDKHPKGDPQARRWMEAFEEKPDRYGSSSDFAHWAARLIATRRLDEFVELGAGQGRDSLFFAAQGLAVLATDFAPNAIAAINEEAAANGVQVNTRVMDVRDPLPFADGSFDVCYSHMLYCMGLSRPELDSLNSEIRRILRPGGLNLFSVRTTEDPDYGEGTPTGEGRFEKNGFDVRYFDSELINSLTGGFKLVDHVDFEEGDLPRKLVGLAMLRTDS